ncbi:ABC transporter ATP-binding protein [Candidatus Methylobacter oryzae]|uniref:ABC transporter ATP-binding protein n=1 Tax=Candidatus Methylobacter oryzae TaxID=2497749 RepID=A0ABY3CEW7_9GAMM|nr:ABC transporter ATP-binding protein [Candidatus Methylobacter oryzae]TRX01790.1 ABC transporter ATP-binding protein [Candidatus Methylobacter oryzae]
MKRLSIYRAAIPFFHLLANEPHRPMMLVFSCMLLGSLSEGFGITLLVPLLELLQNSTAPTTGIAAQFGRFFALTGIPYQVASVLLLFLLLQALRIVLQSSREVTSNSFQSNLVDRLRKRCFMAILRSEWYWLSQRNNAEYANLLLTDINRIGVGVNFFLQLCSGSTLMLTYSLAALWLSWPITLLVLTMGLIFVLAENGLRHEALSLGNRIGQTSRSLHSVVQESLAGMKLAKILGNEERHLDKFQQSMHAFREHQLNFQRSSSRSKARMQLGSVIILVALLYSGIAVWRLPMAELGTLIFVFARLMPLGSQLQQQLHHWLHTLPALTTANRLLTECRDMAEPADESLQPPLLLQHDLTLNAVSFIYPGREQQALSEINLRLPAKSTTAIIGASGAGKSTLADVLMGLLRPDTGCIGIDGQLLDDATRLHWRKSVAYVPQETILFNDSIRANLLWAMPEATDDELWQALDKAAADFVRQLPNGLDTVVGDQGLRLSGGERQRIALARALLGKPSLLILDEATSALDMENEERIRQAIVNLHGNLTVVAIGHRMATLQHADQVLVMEAGSIVAQGSWSKVQETAYANVLFNT